MPATLRSNVVLKTGLDTLWDAAISARTRVTYSSGVSCLRTFLVLHGIFSVLTCGLPFINEVILMNFVAYAFSILKLRYSTIKTYLAGIKYTYMEAGVYCVFDDVGHGSLNRLHTILRGYKKLLSTPIRRRLPITFSILARIVSVLRAGVFGPFDDLLTECMCTIAFFGFMRCSEFTCLSKFDVQVNLCISDFILDPSGHKISIRLKASKTDPFRCGVLIPVFSTKHDVCPVRVTSTVLKLRKRCGASDTDPVFVTYTGTPVTRAEFLRRLDILLTRIGLDCTVYNGHSFRIGASTSAASVRMEQHLIRTLGRWTSDCYMRYIQTPDFVIADAQSSLCTVFSQK
jgi:hypothetical protein